MNPFLATSPIRPTLKARLVNTVNAFKMATFILFITVMQSTIDRLAKHRFQKKIARGETIWLDSLEMARSLPSTQARQGKLAADMTPNSFVKPRKSRAIEIASYPEPAYPFDYQQPPLSGNVINGLGETEKRPVRKVFHSGSYQVAWGGLERFFHASADPVSIEMLRKIRWRDRRRSGLPATQQMRIDDPAIMSDYVKEAALTFGAQLVGITAMEPEHAFEHFDPTPYPHAITLAVSMDLDGMRHATTTKGQGAIMDGYYRVANASVQLAERIRGMGWQALAASNVGADTAEIVHLPLAVAAGIGQLGKHGSIITKEYGSNIRLATVLTDLPLTYDQPADIGVDDFCARCQICVTNCPPQAIFTEKQMVRGVEKWYVDFDKCVPYFSMHNSCGICVAVCPWTEPGRGETISLKMLAQQAAEASI